MSDQSPFPANYLDPAAVDRRISERTDDILQRLIARGGAAGELAAAELRKQLLP